MKNPDQKNEILIFKEGSLELDVSVSWEQETVWLTRNQMVELFDGDVKTIGKHISNALKEELDSEVVVAKFATTTKVDDYMRDINMDIDINVSKVFQDRLAVSMGLDKYRYIMERVNITNVATDMDFQRTFNGFYLVRRNAGWRKVYYEYFETVKNSGPSFESIITYLYECTGNIEPSFASKMLATILPDKPIWDQYVIQNLNIQLKGKTKEEKLKNVVTLYSGMEQWYADFLKSENGKECIREFDRLLPDYKGISNIKKIDSILWSMR